MEGGGNEEKKGDEYPKSQPVEWALRLLELGNDYSPIELTRAYHRRLFAFHPDTSGVVDPEAGRRVDELILARRLLAERISPRREGEGEFDAAEFSGLEAHRQDGAGEQGYLLYRRALSLFGEALDRYWRERLKFSQMPSGSPELRRFHERIREARQLFAAVLEGYPGGIWTADAVEHIARINSWLRGEDGSLGNG